MDCKAFHELLSEWVDHQLDDDTARAMSEHSEICDACRREYEELLLIISNMPAMVELPEGFSERLHHRLADTAKDMRRQRLKQRVAASAGLTAAAAALVLALTWQQVPLRQTAETASMTMAYNKTVEYSNTPLPLAGNASPSESPVADNQVTTTLKDSVAMDMVTQTTPPAPRVTMAPAAKGGSVPTPAVPQQSPKAMTTPAPTQKTDTDPSVKEQGIRSQGLTGPASVTLTVSVTEGTDIILLADRLSARSEDHKSWLCLLSSDQYDVWLENLRKAQGVVRVDTTDMIFGSSGKTEIRIYFQHTK